MHYSYMQCNEVSHCTYTNHFFALHSLEISYSIAPSSWEEQGFENISNILLRPSHEGKQLFWYFISFFLKRNAMLQLTRARWVHTGEQKGNVALFILHKRLNMIFHVRYLTFFSLKDNLASHAVAHIWRATITSFLLHRPTGTKSSAGYWAWAWQSKILLTLLRRRNKILEECMQ